MEFTSEALAEYSGLGLEVWSRPSQAWITVRLSTRCVGLGLRYASIHAVLGLDYGMPQYALCRAFLDTASCILLQIETQRCVHGIRTGSHQQQLRSIQLVMRKSSQPVWAEVQTKVKPNN